MIVNLLEAKSVQIVDALIIVERREQQVMAKKRKFNWDQQLQYAQEALDKNKALIESTSRGTNANKASSWSRRPSKNKSPLQ
jgi:hypothetical protein